jgi:NAD(P)-dependent dehydrogenase (short-subunit alcohol dehydrogenase family)
MIILITGANRGLGFELTKLFASRGHIAVAGAFAGNSMEDLNTLKGKYPDNVRILPLDITSDKSVEYAVREIGDEFGSLDAIINNAGVLLAKEKNIDELDIDEIRMTFEINTFGHYRIIRDFLPLIYKGSSQCILNITSEASSITNAGYNYCSYSMSKVAATMMSQMFSNFLSEKGIRVIAVHPGRMNTIMGRETAQMEPDESAKGIYKLITGETKVTGKVKFVDFTGKPMQL